MAITLRGQAVGAANSYSAGGGTAVTGAFDVQPQVDDYILVNVNGTDYAGTPTVADNAGNTYSQVGSAVGTTAQNGWFFRTKVGATHASLIVTATFATTESQCRTVSCVAVDGADLMTPGGIRGGQRIASSVTGADNTTTGSIGTPDENDHFFFGTVFCPAYDVTALGTGWTALHNTLDPSIDSGYEVQGTAAAFTGLFTMSTAGEPVIAMAQSIRPATGGGGSITFDEDYQISLPVISGW
jgi:hypothetical protein